MRPRSSGSRHRRGRRSPSGCAATTGCSAPCRRTRWRRSRPSTRSAAVSGWPPPHSPTTSRSWGARSPVADRLPSRPWRTRSGPTTSSERPGSRPCRLASSASTSRRSSRPPPRWADRSVWCGPATPATASTAAATTCAGWRPGPTPGRPSRSSRRAATGSGWRPSSTACPARSTAWCCLTGRRRSGRWRSRRCATRPAGPSSTPGWAPTGTRPPRTAPRCARWCAGSASTSARRAPTAAPSASTASSPSTASAPPSSTPGCRPD